MNLKPFTAEGDDAEKIEYINFNPSNILRTKDENLRALKMYVNTSEDDYDIGIISFIFIKDGNLYMACLLQPGVLIKESSSKQIEEILYGLEFKDNKELQQDQTISINDFEDSFLEGLKNINKSL